MLAKHNYQMQVVNADDYQLINDAYDTLMDFRTRLRDAIAATGKSQADFAKKVGVSAGLPGGIIAIQTRKRATPTHIPDGTAEAWADALGLDGDDRRLFLIENAWHYASEDQRAVFAMLLGEVERLGAQLASLASASLAGSQEPLMPDQPKRVRRKPHATP